MSRKGVGGRPRKSQALKKSQGTYRPDRDKNKGQTFPIAVPSGVPDVLSSEYEIDIWKQVTPPLFELAILSPTDIPLLIAFCQQMGFYFECQKIIKTEGKFVGKGYDRKLNPAWKMAKEALQEAHRIGSKFGMTPSDRERLTIRSPKNENKGDVWGEI